MLHENKLAVLAVPFAVFLMTAFPLQSYEANHGSRDAVFLACLVGIPLLTIMVLAGNRFYRENAPIGLVTAICLMAIFPASQACTGGDVWQFAFGLLSGGVGGILSVFFLCLWLRSLSAKPRTTPQAASPPTAVNQPASR